MVKISDIYPQLFRLILYSVINIWVRKTSEVSYIIPWSYILARMYSETSAVWTQNFGSLLEGHERTLAPEVVKNFGEVDASARGVYLR